MTSPSDQISTDAQEVKKNLDYGQAYFLHLMSQIVELAESLDQNPDHMTEISHNAQCVFLEGARIALAFRHHKAKFLGMSELAEKCRRLNDELCFIDSEFDF
jgi:hypothetical protein